MDNNKVIVKEILVYQKGENQLCAIKLFVRKVNGLGLMTLFS